MKKIIVIVVLLSCMMSAMAQTKKPPNSITKWHKLGKATTIKKSKPVTLTSTSENKAYTASAINRLQISDSTINLLNQRAAGINVNVGSSGIVGMPKGTYGFANGRIWLRKTTASTSGSSYGSGGVGTGTSILSAGTSEATIGVNGKSPDAGIPLWGHTQPTYSVPLRDSLKKN